MSRSFRWMGAAGLALLMLACQTPQAHAQDFELITASEAQQEAGAEAAAAPVARTRGGVPMPKDPATTSIQVLTPTAQSVTTAAPLRIELAFKPAPGARIVPSTFRVLYGLLKIDLTDRLRKNATVTENGVVVQGAKVPDGQHRLILQVADDKGNTAEQELRLRVANAS